MKRHYILLVSIIIAHVMSAVGGYALAEDNPYYAGYEACNAQYNAEEGADNTKYMNCIAKAKCTVDNPGDEAYCNCIGDGGVKLNTDVPFVGKCINKDKTSNAFPDLIGGLSKMVVTAILIVSFVMIIAGGVMRTTGNAKGGKDLITKVAIGLAILGASGAILRLINPNFFT